MLGASGLWSLQNVFIRLAATGLDPMQVAFFRNLFMAVFLVAWMVRSGTPILPVSRRKTYVLLAFLHTGAMLSWFTAITRLPLAEATALYFTAPFFVIILAVLFLGEVVRLRRWSAVAIGFVGAMVILRPGYAPLEPATVLVLTCAVLSASHVVIIRSLARTESARVIVSYNFLGITPLTLIPAIIVWQWPDFETLLWCAAVAAVGGCGHLMVARAYRMAEASQLAVFDFVQLLGAALVGYAVFAEVPDRWTWIGGTVIAVSTIYIARREAILRRGPEAPQAQSPGRAETGPRAEA